MISDTDRAYAAGFLDGEGSISLYEQFSRPGRPGKRVQLRVAIANTDLAILAWFKELWGGSITYLARTAEHPKWSDAGQWITHSKIAAAFLADIRPFVRIKARQLDNALVLQSLRHPNGRYTETEWAKFRELIANQRALNARGPAGG